MQAAHYILQSIATPTCRTYPSGECHFMRFCLLHNLISSENALFTHPGVHLNPFCHPSSQLPFLWDHQSYLAAVKNLHIEFDCPLDLFSMSLLFKTLHGIQSSLGISKRSCLPITVWIFHQIYLVLQPSRPMDTDSSMLWAAFTVAFFSFLRCSEFRPIWPDQTFPFTLTCYNLITSKLL